MVVPSLEALKPLLAEATLRPDFVSLNLISEPGVGLSAERVHALRIAVGAGHVSITCAAVEAQPKGIVHSLVFSLGLFMTHYTLCQRNVEARTFDADPEPALTLNSENFEQIHIVLDLQVPREFAFKAWTDAAHLRWFSNPNTPADEPISIDARPGGVWRQHMLIDDKTDYVTGGVFKEVVANERLVFIWGAEDGWPSLKENLVAEVIFEDLNDSAASRMTFKMSLPADWEEKDVNQCRAGWTETLSRFVPATRA